MIVPQIQTWTAGEAPDADTMTARSSAVVDFLLEPPMAAARQTAVQNIPSSTWTKIALDTVDKDNDGIVDLANDRFTITTPGWYEVSLGVGFGYVSTADATRGRRIAAVRLNGSFSATSGGLRGRRDTTPARDSLHTCRTGGSITYMFLNKDDYIELYGYQEGGVSIPTYVGELSAQSLLQVVWFSN